MSHSRKKKQHQPPQRDYKSMLSGWVVALVVLGAVGDRIWKFAPEQGVQRAQLVEVPELTEEIDAPPPVVPEEPSETPEPRTPANPPQQGLREITIEGPIDSIVGDPVHLNVRANGRAINYAWTISPDVEGLFVLDDGSTAIFTNRNAQQYTIYVSAVDELGNIEQDTHTFELVRQKDTLTLQNLSEANPDPSIPEILDYLVSTVPSVNKESEVIIVSQSFRQTANLLRTNAIGPGENVLGKIEKGLQVAMGPASFAPWESNFFTGLEEVLSQYASKGYLTSRDEWVNTLDNLASILESRGQRKSSSPN